jgi:putative hydrolases of HD superfamily
MGKVTPSVQRIAELQQLIADFAKVKRVLELADNGQLENDVEHSYGLALTCWFVASKVAPDLNLERVLLYALAHDIVELHSGDTYVFDKEGVKTKQIREDAALERIRKDWPDFPELVDAAEGYKEKRDAEAKFVYTIDKMLPPILINLGEKEGFWNKNKVTIEMHENEKGKKMKHSPEALPYLEALNEWLRDPDYFYKPEA